MTAPACSAAEALRQFRLIFGAVRQHFLAVEKACGIGGAQVWAMAVLLQHPGMRVSERARAMSIQASTASNLLDKLEQAAFVRRERNSADQRVVTLHLTEAGRAALKKAPPPFTGRVTHGLGQLSHDTLCRLNADLAERIAHMGAVNAGDAHKPLSGR